MISRRRVWALAALLTSALHLGLAAQTRDEARLEARSHVPVSVLAQGEHKLDLGAQRDGFLYLPPGLRPGEPAPLLLMLHGAGGWAANMRRFTAMADRHGIVLLAVDARDVTWDVIRGGFGPDVVFVDRALKYTFDRVLIDPKRVAIGGFSDGASYALSLGLSNGDLFTHVLAFSPGFMVTGKRTGKPDIFMSHGTQDRILPIDRSSRRLVPELNEQRYKLRYEEFDGPHTVPDAIAQQAFEWLAGRRTTGGPGGGPPPHTPTLAHPAIRGAD